MRKDNVIDFKKPEPFIADPITALLRQGARQLLSAALEAEISIFLNQYKGIQDDKGHLLFPCDRFDNGIPAMSVCAEKMDQIASS